MQSKPTIYASDYINDADLLKAMRKMKGVLKISAHPERDEWVAVKGSDTYSGPDLRHLVFSVLRGDGVIPKAMFGEFASSGRQVARVTHADAQVISDLIEVARAANVALQNGVDEGMNGVLITSVSANKLADMLTVLDLLPDREHCLSTGPVKAIYALEHILALLPNVQHVYPGSIRDVHVNGRLVKQRFDLEGKPFGMGGPPFCDPKGGA